MEHLFGGKRSVIFAVPDAFTPTCNEHRRHEHAGSQ
jgi:peroxiredoxin